MENINYNRQEILSRGERPHECGLRVPAIGDDIAAETPIKRFQSLTVRNFRRLATVDIPLRPLTVLIGANGVGKSSLVDALSLLADSAQGKLAAAIGDMSGLGAMATFDRDSEVSFGLSMTVPGYEPLAYSLSLRPQGAAYLILLKLRLEGDRKPTSM